MRGEGREEGEREASGSNRETMEDRWTEVWREREARGREGSEKKWRDKTW